MTEGLDNLEKVSVLNFYESEKDIKAQETEVANAKIEMDYNETLCMIAQIPLVALALYFLAVEVYQLS